MLTRNGVKIQLFFLFLVAPFLGVLVSLVQFAPAKQLDLTELHQTQSSIGEQTAQFGGQLSSLSETVQSSKQASQDSKQLLQLIQSNAQAELLAYEEQKLELERLVKSSAEQGEKSAGVLDSLLANMLGDPIGQTFGERATVKVYSLQEAGYRGYMAKVRLHDSRAVKMVLAEDKVASKGETTSAAAKRQGAILAVNAGGFQSENGLLRPLGTTVVDGKIVTFSQSDLSFIGFNQQGKLVGGQVTSQEQLSQMGVLQGASFLPTLLKDGKKQTIPKAWANTRHPRTLIGHFENGDLLFIVIDGRQKGWSNGVTLEEAQEKLLEFKVKDAYNLDGGGSSAFYYNGKILNKPSGGAERKVTTNLLVFP